MRTTTQDTEFIFEQREDANGDIVGTGTGRAVPYGVEIEIGGVRESFARDAFNVEDVIGKPLAYRHNEPVGIITGAENREDGLYIDFDIVNTTLGRDAATLARTGASRGLSVGFNPIKSAWTKTRDAVQHMSAGLQEVSLTPYPAYSTAGVSAIREEEGVPMSETIVETEVVSVDTEAREAIAQVRETVASIEARAFVSEPVHPLAVYRSFGEYSKAVLAGEVESRALADQVTANNPGVLPPMWMLNVKGIIDLGRPVITGIGGPESAGTSGMEINWPYFEGNLLDIVEAQASEKGEVNSVEIDIEKGDATLVTYAAGSDISYQLLQRSSPSYLDAHNRIMAASYSAVTDRKFTNDLWTSADAASDVIYDMAADTTGAVFRASVFEASMTVEDATGTPATIVFASTALMKEIGGWESFYPAPYSVQNVSGVATASTLQVNVSGLRVVRAKWLDTLASRHAIVTNGEAARWIEDGPRLATAENVGKLGTDIAIYGYGVTGAYLPAGISRLLAP
jgi:HK97 family phage prohead protease